MSKRCRSAPDRRNARARDFHHAQFRHDLNKSFDFRGLARHFEDEMLGRGIDHLGTENFSQTQRFDAPIGLYLLEFSGGKGRF